VKELKGIPAAPGLARGVSRQWKDVTLEVPSFKPVDPAAEKIRLAQARWEAGRQLQALVARVSKQVGEAEAVLFEAQAMFLNDTALVGRAESKIDSGLNAEQAWQQACEHFASQLEGLPDETLQARAADVRDVGRRVFETLLGIQTGFKLDDQSILLARDLVPSQTVALDTSKVLAFCTAEGGATSHTAILAKALGIPAVVGIGDELLQIPDGRILLVDGTAGLVASDPDPELLAKFEQRIQAEQVRRQLETELSDRPAMTRDGHRVEVAANVGSVEDARKALEHNAEGIGLLRTEFLFLNRKTPPDEQTQFAAYKTILDLMDSRPVVVRTLDVGGDKEVPYYDFGPEANPFLGYRAIRISLDRPVEFKSQLRALLRAGVGHDLRIMFPMIAMLAEVHQAKEMIEEARAELRSDRIAVVESVQVGIMVEIPAVAMLAERFAPEVDFFSIGTNDLTQYTFAAERGNKRVSHLNDPCHPAILRQIEQVVKAAHVHGKWVGVCGEMAGDLQAVPILLGLGVDELSMSPAQIPGAKQIIRQWSLADAQKLAGQALDLDSSEAVRKTVRRAQASNIDTK
jgi:phosphoenolpyruvate-protein phosphotransferase